MKMCIWSDVTEVQGYEIHYVNAWLKRCVFNLDLNRESVSEPWTLSGRLFQSLGAKCEKVLPPLVDFAILLPRVQSFATLGSGLDCSVIED